MYQNNNQLLFLLCVLNCSESFLLQFHPHFGVSRFSVGFSPSSLSSWKLTCFSLLLNTFITFLFSGSVSQAMLSVARCIISPQLFILSSPSPYFTARKLCSCTPPVWDDFGQWKVSRHYTRSKQKSEMHLHGLALFSFGTLFLYHFFVSFLLSPFMFSSY